MKKGKTELIVVKGDFEEFKLKNNIGETDKYKYLGSWVKRTEKGKIDVYKENLKEITNKMKRFGKLSPVIAYFLKTRTMTIRAIRGYIMSVITGLLYGLSNIQTPIRVAKSKLQILQNIIIKTLKKSSGLNRSSPTGKMFVFWGIEHIQTIQVHMYLQQYARLKLLIHSEYEGESEYILGNSDYEFMYRKYKTVLKNTFEELKNTKKRIQVENYSYAEAFTEERRINHQVYIEWLKENKNLK